MTAHGILQNLTGLALRQLNADERTKAILAADPAVDGANLKAAQEIDAELAACIEQGEDVLVETVLSSEKYLDDVERAKARGYSIGIIYVSLATPEESVRRVALRRELGGHDVPIDRIKIRWRRSIEMLARFVPFATALYVLDNTEPSGSGGPQLIAFKDDSTGKVVLTAPGRIPSVDRVLAPFT